MLFDLKVLYCIILYYMLQDEFVLFYKNRYDNIDIINNNFIKLQLSKILFFFNLGQEQVLDYLLLVKVLLF